MELVFEQQGIVPGGEFWIGWRMIRDKGWHTYWKHPGDVGVPPSIKWEFPSGFVAGKMLYSPPEKVKMGSIRANGNYGETLIAYKLGLIAAAKADVFVTLYPKNEWDICAGHCIVNQSGGILVDLLGNPIKYNQETTLINPGLISGSKNNVDSVLKIINT